MLDQVSVEATPDFTLLGLAARVTVGALPETVTVADWVADPPAPVQVSSYSVLCVRAPVDIVPLVARLRFQPPEPMQAVAPWEFQLRVELPPLLIVVGAAVKVTETVTGVMGAVGAVGAATVTATDWVVVPPDPLQASV